MKTYMNPEIVFAIYKPHQNKGNELKKLIKHFETKGIKLKEIEPSQY